MQIILINNGLQTFERSAEVEGNGTLDLFFKSKDMPEILKSLTLSSSGKGLQTCSFEMEGDNRSVNVEIPESSALIGLLKSLKGEHVSVTCGEEEVLLIVFILTNKV